MKVNSMELTERLPQLAFFGLSPSYYGLEMHNRLQEVLLVQRSTRNGSDSYFLPNNIGRSCNSGPAKYRIPQWKVLPRWLPHGRHRRLLRPHHGWTHTIEILDSAGLPTRHDGAHRHGSGDCNDCLWHPRPQKRCHHLGLAYFQWQSGAGKPWTNEQMILKYNAFMVVPPLTIANKYHDHQTDQPKSVRYRLILVRASDLDWLRGDRLKDLQAQATAGHK